jgi:outer membrane immunogenic protein
MIKTSTFIRIFEEFILESHMKKLLFATALSVLAAPAFAQDAQTFSGFFVGAQTGWQGDRVNIPNDTTGQSVSKDGWQYGAQAGYDFRLDRVVLGVEAMISGSSGTGEAIDTAGNSYKLNAGTTFGFSGRAGYLVSDPVLLYGRVGYTWASYNYVFNNSIESSYDQDGIVVGLGAEYQFSENISARLEWNYSDLGDDTFQRPPKPPSVFLPQELNFERSSVLFGINYRF